ncbi:MAG TPA: hypothetical protein PLX89_06285 [Verrucomicrobiota bacterium]|nr:hypothetical protein [Verrucomicrobiales bacterium]HRI12599.1 hypothetical protein [Verrucomicrobiota bacterium]
MNHLAKAVAFLVASLLGQSPCLGAERVFNFATTPLGKMPEGFKAFVAGSGPPANWQVVLADVPSVFQPLLAPTNAPTANQLPVLAQLSQDPTNERFPVLYFDGERYGDFTFTTRFRLVRGAVEQMAGVVFRLQDERNFYVIRASGLGNVRFYKFVAGERSTPIGNDLPIKRNQWYELTVRTVANRIDVLLDGQQAFPTLTDNSFLVGKVGFMTKSDAVSQFLDPKVVYQPLVTVAETLVRDTLEKQPRLLNLRLYGKTSSRSELHVLAAKNPSELGLAGTDVETRVFETNETFLGKNEDEFLVTSPLRDRNGEVIAVVKFFLRPFAGQTEANVAARVLPTVRWMESRLAAAEGLGE